jgi:hypothetical protein
LVDENSVKNLIYGESYEFKYFANNSRPAVSFNVFVNDILAYLEEYSNSIVGFQTDSQCDFNQLCNNSLTYNVTLNDPSLFLYIKNISFNAFNTTAPFNISTRYYVANINITVPENKTFISSQQNIAVLNNSTASLSCFSIDTLTPNWYFSPFAFYAGFTTNCSFNFDSSFLINDNQSLKYFVDTNNSLTILNVNQQNDEGYYACGSPYGTSFIGSIAYLLFVARTFFFLFIKINVK